VGIYQQYSENLDSEQRVGTTIGSTYISGQTQYESSTAVQMDYTLYEFGVRSNKREMAKIDRELVDYTLDESAQKLKLKLLDTYSKLLTHSNELKHYQNIKNLQSTMYFQTKRLYEAGKVDKLSLSDRAIEVVELDRNIEQSKSNVKEQFEVLSFFTKEQYDHGTHVLSFNTTNANIAYC
jgi:outer membrane protein TolC